MVSRQRRTIKRYWRGICAAVGMTLFGGTPTSLLACHYCWDHPGTNCFDRITQCAMRIASEEEAHTLVIEVIETVTYGNPAQEFCMRNNVIRSIEAFQKEIKGTVHDYDAVLDALPQKGYSGSVFVNGYHWKWTRYSAPIVDDKFRKTVCNGGYIASLEGYVKKFPKSDILDVRVKFERNAYYLKHQTAVMRDILGVDTTVSLASVNDRILLANGSYNGSKW